MCNGGKMIISVLLISFLLEPILSNINISIITITVFTMLLSIILVYPYLKLNKLLIYSAFSGLLYDILFSPFFIDIIIFPLIAVLIYYLFKELKYSIINIIIVSSFIIFIYLNITYIVSWNFTTNSYTYLISKLVFIYLFNSIYIIICYFIMNIISFKKCIK